MPTIPLYEKTVGVERAVAPEIPQGWLTDKFRAVAQLGESGRDIATLLQNLQEMEARTEGNNLDVEISTLQNTLITTKWGNEQWRATNLGDGNVMERTGVIDPQTGLEQLRDTGIKKIPISMVDMYSFAKVSTLPDAPKRMNSGFNEKFPMIKTKKESINDR